MNSGIKEVSVLQSSDSKDFSYELGLINDMRLKEGHEGRLWILIGGQLHRPVREEEEGNSERDGKVC